MIALHSQLLFVIIQEHFSYRLVIINMLLLIVTLHSRRAVCTTIPLCVFIVGCFASIIENICCCIEPPAVDRRPSTVDAAWDCLPAAV